MKEKRRCAESTYFVFWDHAWLPPYCPVLYFLIAVGDEQVYATEDWILSHGVSEGFVN